MNMILMIVLIIISIISQINCLIVIFKKEIIESVENKIKEAEYVSSNEQK